MCRDASLTGATAVSRFRSRIVECDGIASLAADAMMAPMPLRPQPLIAVGDVEVSSRFYQRLLDCESGHGGREYERLMFDGELVLQLHDANTADHDGRIGDPALPYGNGAMLWFAVDAFEAAVARARQLRAEIVHEPHGTPNARRFECWLCDPDGYAVVLAGPPGEIGGATADV